jgi:hypothetical protein
MRGYGPRRFTTESAKIMTIEDKIKLLQMAVIWLILMVIGLFLLAIAPAHAGEHPTLGQCMAASAMAGAHNYEWQEKKFSREDCEAITTPAPNAVEPAPKISDTPMGVNLQKPDPVEIHIHNPPPPAPVIIQKPSPTINIHIHNERGGETTIGPQSTLSDAPATHLKNTHTPHNRYIPTYVPSDVRPDLFVFPPRCCNEYLQYGECDPYTGCAH